MRIEGEYIVFENLSQPSSSIVGEKESVRAKTPSFVSSNAKGVIRKVADIENVESLGKLASEQLKKIFE